MTRGAVEQIADAILYEGYLLYPYRPSALKNRQRWNFGGLCPRAYSEAQAGTELWRCRTECLAVAEPGATLAVKARSLHLIERRCARLRQEATELAECRDADLEFVETLKAAGRVLAPWQEAAEREVGLPETEIRPNTAEQHVFPFSFGASRTLEPVREADGKLIGALVREQQAVEGAAHLTVEALEGPLVKITLELLNLTEFAAAPRAKREEAMLYSLVSSHAILKIRGGEFVSLLEPPAAYAEAAGECKNVGMFPVLAGEKGQRSTMLTSPVILYDYPTLAPESAGELFDSTEIDEILTLRIMTLTDEEKGEMRQGDERARRILERIEADPEHLARLHGTVRTVERKEGGAER